VDQPQVFDFLYTNIAAGKRCALVTVCAVEGSSMRNPGTHMGVCEDGTFEGSLSGGCIENAVVAEAQAALAEGKQRVVRFGAGSPYLDIKLPCGGGLDIHFEPLPDSKFVDACRAAQSARRPFAVTIDESSVAFSDETHTDGFDLAAGKGTFTHWPVARLLIIGHGAGVEALASLGRTMGCDIEALTPDDRVEAQLKARSIRVSRLEKTSDTHLLSSDPWTAFIFLFHDHDWETALIRRALELPHFYIGAMGGRRAHSIRSAALAATGVSEQAIGSIHAPIGLFHSSRDPQTLALSALGEVVRTYHDCDFKQAAG